MPLCHDLKPALWGMVQPPCVHVGDSSPKSFGRWGIVVPVGTDAAEFGLDNRGPAALVVVAVFSVIGAGVSVWLAGRTAIAFVFDEPGLGEAGRAAMLGFFCTFASLSYLAGEYAWRGRSGLIAYRSPGSVSIEGDILRIDAPGIVSHPVELHRDWVAGAEERKMNRGPHKGLGPGVLGTTCVICLRRPIGIPQAIRQPLVSPRAPDPLDPSLDVEAIALDVKDRRRAVARIDQWAKETPATAPGEPAPPRAADHKQRNRRILAWAVMAVALTSTFLTLPR